MHHGAVYRGQVLQEFGLVEFQIVYDYGTGLGDNHLRIFVLDVSDIGGNGQLRAETDVKTGLHPQRLQQTVEFEV